jgi:CRISPR-associated protein Cas1
VLSLLAAFRDAAEQAADLQALLGIEGTAAALYFEHFDSMLKQREPWSFDWRGRNRRPPRDPVNAMLSLGYSMLAKELTGVCHAVGLDPFLGIHAPASIRTPRSRPGPHGGVPAHHRRQRRR